MSDTPVSTAPDSAAEQVMEAVSAALAAQDLPQAMELAATAVADGWRNPVLFNLAAYRLETERRYPDAAAMLEQGLQSFPNDLELLTSLGLCLNRIGRAARAVAAFDTVLQAAPDFLPAHQGKGEALERLGDIEGAERHYRAAVEGMPDYADALGALAMLLARTGRAAEARTLAQRALDLDPRRTGARMALAYCDLASGDASGAEAAARAVLSEAAAEPEEQAMAASTLGDALDAQGRFDDAFVAFTDGAARLKAVRAANVQTEEAAETYFDLVQRLTAWFNRLTPGVWAPDAGSGESPAAGHVFILGAAARSGADLLQRVLAANPGVVALDGGDSLATAEAEFLLAPGGLDRLAKLGAEDGARLRTAYWARAAELGGDPKGKVVVDRLPLGAAGLGLVAALFPKAKVILALRDPRDVVLTGLRRPTLMNGDLHGFMSLAGGAELYDATMRLLESCWEKLPLEVAEARHEDLVANPEAETRSLSAFTGLTWDHHMVAAAATSLDAARGRDDRSRWRDYAGALAPAMPVLKPWAERFGYPEG